MAIIWLDPEAGTFVTVDEIDYEWAIQWRWHVTPNQRKKKFYATRMTVWPKTTKQRKVYMHKEILIRMGVKPRTKKHVIGDHKNGDSLDCRRDNLRYATHSMNNKNRRCAGG